MSERGRGGDRPQSSRDLIDELWPSPEPPVDLAARVLAAQARAAMAPGPGAGAGGARRPGAERLRRRTLAVAFSIAAAAAVALLLPVRRWFDAHDDPPSETGASDGQLVAAAAQTVNIGVRAAAAAEPGADLAWSVAGQRARVDQRRGSVFYRVNHGGPFRVVTPAGDVEVTGTCFRVSLAAGATGPAATTLVAVLEGSVKVHTDAGTLAIGVGQTARLTRGHRPEVVETPADAASADQLQGRLARAEARLQDLERQLAEREHETTSAIPLHHAAALVLPWSSRVRVYGDRPGALKEVSLALSPLAGAPGGGDASQQPIRPVQVARDPGFKQPVWSGLVRQGFVTVPAPARGDLYWRQTGEAATPGHARFLADQRPALLDLGSPHNLVSDDRDSTTVHFQGAPPALTLTFAPAAGALRYRVRIYRASDLDQPIFDRQVIDPRCPVEPGRLPEGTYVWNALPLDQAGQALGGGRMSKLELAYDNALAGLALSRLQIEAAGAGPGVAGVAVAGMAPPGARLFVNGQPAALDQQGRFALRLAGAPEVVVFRLLARDGAESYWVKAVKPPS